MEIGRYAVASWKTKPTDRFILKWIKMNLSARITPRLLHLKWLEPWMITLFSSSLGVLAGIVFGLGCGWGAGILACFSQVLDGVDGQFARITGLQSRGGAFWDSVLDRYSDGAIVIGVIVYLVRLGSPLPSWLTIILGAAALIGGGLISYSTARAENLSIDLGKPTLASKGTRTAAVIVAALGSIFWAGFPIFALIYLAIHTNLVVACRLLRALHHAGPIRDPEGQEGKPPSANRTQ